MTRFWPLALGIRLAAVAALGVFAFAGAAQAQLSETGGPVSYSADRGEYYDNEHRLVLTGDVDVIQNDSRLRANVITLYFTPTASPTGGGSSTSSSTTSAASSSGGGQALHSGDIQRMIADGEVYFVRPAQSARGDHAVYEVSSDTVTFTGNVVIASTDNVIRGDNLQLKISDRQTVIRPRTGGRVQGVFVPQNSQNQQGQPNQQHPPGAPAAPAAPAPAGQHH